MLTTLFEKTSFSSYLYSGAILLLIAAHRYFNTFGPEINSYGIGYQLAEFTLVYIALLLSGIYFRERGFLKGNNTYALFFALIYGYVPIEYNAISVWIQLNLVLWAAILFLRVSWKKAPHKLLLDTSLFLGLSFVLSWSNIGFIAVLYIGLFFAEIRERQLFFIPLVVVAGYFFILLSANQMVSFPILTFPKTFLIEPGSLLLHPSKEEVLWLTLGGLGGGVLLWELIFRRRFNKIQNNNNLLLLGILVLTTVQGFWLDSEADKMLFLLPIIAFTFKRINGQSASSKRGNYLAFLLIGGLLSQYVIVS